MNIQHRPQFDISAIIQLYSRKDNVDISYVCTSAIHENDAYAADIFYRSTPHPEFGNRYFGIFRGHSNLMITNADNIENLTFECIGQDDKWHYSQHRHDFYSIGNIAIDGGRAYIRLVGDVNLKNVGRKTFKIKNGQFYEV